MMFCRLGKSSRSEYSLTKGIQSTSNIFKPPSLYTGGFNCGHWGAGSTTRCRGDSVDPGSSAWSSAGTGDMRHRVAESKGSTGEKWATQAFTVYVHKGEEEYGNVWQYMAIIYGLVWFGMPGPHFPPGRSLGFQGNNI